MATNQAATENWALVSGLPTEQARSRLLVMLQAYVDGSTNFEGGNSLVLAGYIATSAAWAKFSEEWKQQLDHAHLPYLKMSELAARPEIAAYFYRLIENHDILVAISIAVDVDGMRRAVDDFIPEDASSEAKRYFKNPYYMAFKCLIDAVVVRQVQFGLGGPIDFIFDDQSEKGAILASWEWQKVFSSPVIRDHYGSTPIFRDDQKFMPLQAADLYAWWVRKWHSEGDLQSILNYAFPWGLKRRIRQLHVNATEEQCRTLLADMFKKMPTNVSIIQAFGDPKIAREWVNRRDIGIPMTLPDPTSSVRLNADIFS